MTLTHTKPLPTAPEAEKGLLGCILLDCEPILTELNGKISPSHFNLHQNRVIYSTMLELYKASKPFDLVVLTEALHGAGKLEEIGGPAYITEISNGAGSKLLWKSYADTILERHMQREVIKLCADFSVMAYDSEDPKDLVSGLASRVAEITVPQQEEGRKSFKDLVLDKLSRLEHNEEDGDVIKTGIRLLDKHSPIRHGSFPVISAETKCGKTILACQIAKEIAKQGHGVLFFALESPAQEIIDNMFKNESGIPQELQNTKAMSQFQLKQCMDSAERMATLNLGIEDSVFDIADIVSIAKKEKAQNPKLAAIFVDYLQLVRGQQTKGGNREQEVAMVSRTLRMLAMELKVAVFALSQLNDDGRARESRAIQNDCTQFWVIKRNGEDNEGERNIHVAFQRNGASNIFFPMQFRGEIAKFSDKD